MDREPRVCDYEGSSYKTDFWDGQGREYEDLAERIALEHLLPPAGRRLVDIGGGFPRSYPDYPTPPLDDYFKVIRELSDRLPLAEQGELLVEPGRALAAPGLSAVVEVLMRKDDRLYINDGMYGIFWELRFDAHQRYPVRVYRDGRELAAGGDLFRLYGPTCDSSDMLPGRVPLPSDVQAGDYLEFSRIGAYSLSGRTNFNGHFSDRVIEILA
mgnify:CR=1 FL=1